MNFVLISPNFPKTYWQFAFALKRHGMTVLGIGDSPFQDLSEELKSNLTEYYYCPGMNDYREMYRAFAYFSYKYGKIDWVESNNEYWMEKDARLRSDFNITTGIQSNDIRKYKAKSEMKRYFQLAGVLTARYHLVDTIESCRIFLAEIGYPAFVKPNIGAGAISSFKITCEADLIQFFAIKDRSEYIMEEFIDGTVVSFDGIADGQSNVVFCASNVFPVPNHEIVNDKRDDFYYTLPQVPKDLERMGRNTIKAFQVQNRFFHLEFFRLNRPSAYFGDAGTIVALEVNMRPAGGYTPEMINSACGVSCQLIWGDVIALGESRQPVPLETAYCVEAARHDQYVYCHTHEEILRDYGSSLVMTDRYPPIINVGMGDTFYIIRLKTMEEVLAFQSFVLSKTI